MAKVRPIGEIDCTWTEESGYQLTKSGEFNNEFLLDSLRELSRKNGGPVALRVQVLPVRRGRSLAQNDMMWALLTMIAEHQTGRAPSGEDVMATYCDMLCRYGSEYQFLEVPKKAIRELKKAYRAIKVVEYQPGGRVTVMAVAGSSSFDKSQMHDFLEYIFDVMAAEGIEDPRLPGWRQDLSAEKERR